MDRKSKKKRRGKRTQKKMRNESLIRLRKKLRKQADRKACISKFVFLALLLVLTFFVPVAHAQTNVSLTGRIGTARQLGFRVPSVAAGVNVERNIGHVTLGTDVWLSPDRKASCPILAVTGGHSISASGYGALWLRRVAPVVGLSYSMYWLRATTETYHKGQASPYVGVMAATGIGRFTASYSFPTGCQWNPGCTLQSPRLRGLALEQDVDLSRRLTLGFSGAVLRFCDQSNPRVVIERTCHTGGTAFMVLRYRLR